LGSIVFYNFIYRKLLNSNDRKVLLALRWLFNFIGFNLTMVMMPEWYGISDGSLPAYFFFIGWHLVDWFCTNYFYHLPNNIFHKESEKDYILG
jgi:UMF1 family MFS transporter